MRLLVIALSVAMVVVTADAAKCKGKGKECVKKDTCTALVTTDKCRKGKECCSGGTEIKRNCNPTDLCKGDCRSKCLKGEKKFKNKKNKKYCVGKEKCICCLGYCKTKGACSLQGGRCLPKGMKCKGGTMNYGAGLCSKNIKKYKGEKTVCGCCIPNKPTTVAPTTTTTEIKVPTWSYKEEDGPDTWAANFEFCAGQSQSPINFVPIKTTLTVTDQDPWVLTRYNVTPPEMKIKNTGLSAKVAWKTEDLEELPSVKGGALGAEYTFAQYHFHWGSVSTQGSEHTIDGVMFPNELHLVHFKKEYGSLGGALGQDDGLAVLGIMLELANEDNAKLNPIIDGLKTITASGSEEYMATPHALIDVLPADPNKFFRYQGSLTTPTCNEVVTWTVFTEPIGISEAQLEVFRSLLSDDGDNVVDNWRPVQPLNGREVFTYSLLEVSPF